MPRGVYDREAVKSAKQAKPVKKRRKKRKGAPKLKLALAGGDAGVSIPDSVSTKLQLFAKEGNDLLVAIQSGLTLLGTLRIRPTGIAFIGRGPHGASAEVPYSKVSKLFNVLS